MSVPRISVESLRYLSTSVENSRSTYFLANFTIEMMGEGGGGVKQDLYSNECISAEKQSTEINLEAYREEVFFIVMLKTVFKD